MLPPGRPDHDSMTQKVPSCGEEQVEGRNPVLEALRGPREVGVIYLARGTNRSGAIIEIIKLAGREGITVIELDRGELARMAGTPAPQGVIARVAPYRYMELGDLIRGFKAEEVPLVLVLDGVEDPQNFGSLLRVADATGVDGVIAARRRACPVTPSVCKASAGAVEHVKVVQVGNIASTLVRLKEEGLWVVGAEASGGIPYYRVDLSLPSVVVLGGEGKGLGRLVRQRCDRLAALPMMGKVSSINVASAGAVILFEALRQRREVQG